MMTHVENVHQYGKFWIDENQIYNFKYHPGTVINLEEAQFISIERKKIFNGESYPILVDGRGVKYISSQASKYLSSDENVELFIACAFIIDSFLSRMMSNYYLNAFPPKVPTKLFNNREEAIKWLIKYK